MNMTMNIDKQNGDICFNENAHTYFNLKDPKKKYISVTTLIHKFEPPFDKNFWSAYKAVEQLINPEYWKNAKKELLATKSCPEKLLLTYDIPIEDFNAIQQNVLDTWQRENMVASQRGSTIHADLENSFYAQKTDISLKKYGLGGVFTCIKGKTELDLDNGIYPEYLVYYESPDNKINVAGQIDVLVKEGKSFSIIDWKGLPLDTKIPTLRGWTTIQDIKIGEKVFDKNGTPCAVVHKSEVHLNPCYKITFDTGEEIVADEEHRWLVEELLNRKERVLTTKEIAEYISREKTDSLIIRNAAPLDILPGLGKHFENADNWEVHSITALLKEILRSPNIAREKAYKIVSKYCVRPDLARNCYVVENRPFTKLFVELLHTLGIRTEMNLGEITFKAFPPYTDNLNSLIGEQNSYREIKSVEPVDTVPTQCLEVDSPTHTFLCTDMMLVTHNTNKQIKTSSYYNKQTKRSEKLEYPLNDLDNCNYSTYNMQLSTYAWMIQQLHPDWKCNELILVHFNHEDKMTVYKMKYLKEQVEKMIAFWKKQAILEKHREQRRRIEY